MTFGSHMPAMPGGGMAGWIADPCRYRVGSILRERGSRAQLILTARRASAFLDPSLCGTQLPCDPVAEIVENCHVDEFKSVEMMCAVLNCSSRRSY